MSKRRRGERHTHHQVPSLRTLAQHAVNVATGRPVARTWRNMDTPMSESRSVGTQSSKRSRTLAEGAEQVGQGLQVTIPKNVPVLYNNNYTVTLRYAQSDSADIAYNGGSGSRHFRTDTIFDPDSSGTGHQPLMRDLWASQYDYYTVLACRYRIHFFNANYDTSTYTSVGTSSQRLGSMAITILPTTNTSDISAAASGLVYPALEMKNNRSAILHPEHTVDFSGEFTPGDFVVDAKDSDTDNTWTAVGSNPTVGRYIGIIINSTTPSGLVGINEVQYARIEYVTELEYDVQFTQMNQSLRTFPS